MPNAREDVPIVLRLPRPAQGSLAAVRELRLGPNLVAIGELTREETRTEADSLYHKNLLPVTYVTGDLAGAAESPVYAILRMNSVISHVTLPEGYAFEIYNTHQPFDTTKYAMKWDGEWHITYEVFRDLGLAFAAVLVLIYILVVWWFEAFGVPLTIMAAIPFSLVGILPAHAAMGAFFTATSMIGFIAGAGIVVRNSIILVDFIEMRLREGMPLAEAVVDAGAVRFRPMALTAAAVIVGSAVILFDPIFQGLAISLMAGEVASLLLSRVTVPVLYFMSHQKRRHHRLRPWCRRRQERCHEPGREHLARAGRRGLRRGLRVGAEDGGSRWRRPGMPTSPSSIRRRPEAPAYFTADQIDTLEAEREQSRAGTAARCRALARQHVRRAVHVVVEEGPPEDALLRMADRLRSDRRRHTQAPWRTAMVAGLGRGSRRPPVTASGARGSCRCGRARSTSPGSRFSPPEPMSARVDAWVDVLGPHSTGTVVRSPDIHQCAPDRLQNTDLIVLSMPADRRLRDFARDRAGAEGVRPSGAVRPLNRWDRRKESVVTVERALRLIAGLSWP